MQGSSVSCTSAKVALVRIPRHVNPMWESNLKSDKKSGFCWVLLVIPVIIATLCFCLMSGSRSSGNQLMLEQNPVTVEMRNIPLIHQFLSAAYLASWMNCPSRKPSAKTFSVFKVVVILSIEIPHRGGVLVTSSTPLWIAGKSWALLILIAYCNC